MCKKVLFVSVLVLLGLMLFNCSKFGCSKTSEPETQLSREELYRMDPKLRGKTHSFATKGKVEVYDAKQGKWQKIEKNKPVIVNENDEIKTEKNSEINVQIVEKAVVNVAEKTKVKVSLLKKNEKNEIKECKMNLTKGKLLAKVKNIAPGIGKFEVETPRAVAGVRGTTFEVNNSEDNKYSTFAVLAGTVEVKSKLDENLKIILTDNSKITQGPDGLFTKVEKLSTSEIEKMANLKFANYAIGIQR